MTLTTEQTPATAPSRRTRRWIDDWRPEDPDQWENGGRRIARRNLAWSIFAEHLGFSVWLIWSVSSAFLLAQGFEFTPQQLFLLVALPNLVGSLLRLPYTFAVPKFGGRNWTIVSAALLLVPTLLFAVAVQDSSTPWQVCGRPSNPTSGRGLEAFPLGRSAPKPLRVSTSPLVTDRRMCPPLPLGRATDR
jgi:MFS transporter, NNP family, nitrate/nitrite transporter